jgi:hypothetical protein
MGDIACGVEGRIEGEHQPLRPERRRYPPCMQNALEKRAADPFSPASTARTDQEL